MQGLYKTVFSIVHGGIDNFGQLTPVTFIKCDLIMFLYFLTLEL